jgi:hypothetical protein
MFDLLLWNTSLFESNTYSPIPCLQEQKRFEISYGGRSKDGAGIQQSVKNFQLVDEVSAATCHLVLTRTVSLNAGYRAFTLTSFLDSSAEEPLKAIRFWDLY